MTLGVLPDFILATGVECGDTIDYNLAPGSQAHIMQLKKDLMHYMGMKILTQAGLNTWL